MHIVICLDDRNGIQFNRRRLSSDRAVSARILEMATGNLWMNPNSAKLFPDARLCADEDYLNQARAGDTCFAENLDFLNYMDKAESVTVYRWNRTYPSDTKVPADVLAGWILTQSTDFPGNSHETVTEERYIL